MSGEAIEAATPQARATVVQLVERVLQLWGSPVADPRPVSFNQSLQLVELERQVLLADRDAGVADEPAACIVSGLVAGAADETLIAE